MSVGTTLEKLKVVIEADAKDYKKTLKEAVHDTADAAKEIQKETKSIENPFKKIFDNNPAIKKIKEVNQALKQIRSNYREKAGFDERGFGIAAKSYIHDSFKQSQIRAGVKSYTPEYEATRMGAEKAAQAVDKLKKKQMDMSASGVSRQSEKWKKLQADIKTAERRVESYKAKMARLEGTGKDVQFTGFKNIAGGVMSKLSSGFSTNILPAIQKVSGAFGALLKKFVSGISGVNRLKKSMSGLEKSGKGLGGIFKTIGMTAKFMLASFLIQRAITGIRDGLQNLARYSKETNADLSTLKSGLTQLKNSLATAFAPILTVVIPILSKMIQAITQAINSVGKLFATLTGKSTFVRAVAVQENYAASLDSTASSAKKAKNELYGFDEITKQSDDSDSSGGSGTVSPSEMFQDVEIEDEYFNLVGKIKESWSKADFTELGSVLGGKINSALQGIQWTEIQGTVGKVAQSTATFLNGALQETDWSLVGTTLAGVLNAVINAGYNFARTFDYKKFGTAISDGIDGFVRNVDTAKAGKTLSGHIKGILTTISTTLENTDWQNIGVKIKGFFINIDWTGIVSDIAETIGGTVGAVAGILVGAFKEVPGKIKKYFLSKKDECGGSLVKGIFKGIVDALKGVGQWIKKNILNPIVKGFKKAFGIHSPSKVFAELGLQLIAGLYEGVIEKIKGVKTWLKENVVDKITKAWEESKVIMGIKAAFNITKSKVEEWAGNVKSWWGEKKLDIGNSFSTSKSNVMEWYDNVKNWWGDRELDIKNKLITTATGVSSWFSSIKKWWGNRKLSITTKNTTKASTLWTKLKNAWGKRTLSTSVATEAASNVYRRFERDWNKSKKVLALEAKLEVSSIVTKGGATAEAKAKGGIFTNGSWKPVTAYAGGGLPSVGQMFLAREAGPELVGTIGGHTAVMNNNQIVSSVAAGVASAVAGVVSRFQGSSSTPELHIYLGGKEMTDYVIKDINGRIIATGMCPINV